MLPASRGAEVEAGDGKEDDVAQGFTIVPLETLENVLALMASVMRGGSNRDDVGEEAEITEGDGLRGDEPLQPGNSPRLLPPPPALRARASRAVSYASWTTDSATPAPDESRSHTERTLSPAVPSKSVEAERTGRGPEASGLGTRAGASEGISAGEDAGDGEGGRRGNVVGGDRETVVPRSPGSSSRFSTMDIVDSGAGVAT